MTHSKKMLTKNRTEDYNHLIQSDTPHIETILNFINLESNGRVKKTLAYSVPVKIYKLLEHDDKEKIAIHTADIIRNCYFKNLDFKINIYKFTLLFNAEKDWTHIKFFLERILQGSIDLHFISVLCKNIFYILDRQFSSEHASENISGACLALISEIGVHIKDNAEKVSPLLKNKHLGFLDYLSSNMLARSNINSETLHVALVYYFSKVEPLSLVYKQRVLTRFGQSLLEHVLNAYFSGSKKSELAFYFIQQHFDDFLCSSPALAEMSNAVLQNQMLKHTEAFPLFIKRYVFLNLRDLDYKKARSIVIHLSFLLKEACALNQKYLIESLLEITLSYIHLFEKRTKETIIDLYEVLGEIISSGKSTKAKEISKIIFDKILSSKKAIDSANAYKLIHLDSKHRDIYTKARKQMDGEHKPSPLQEILLLAS